MSGKIVPVIGMHRSGTSALAGALHSGGVSMGSERHFRPKPMPENPKGFYEDHRFRRINDLICERNGYRVKSWGRPPRTLDDTTILLGRRALLLLRRDRTSSSWGWKDPRTCLTFDLWASALQLVGRLKDTHVVLVIRDPRAVSESLHRRNGLARERGAALWLEYNARLVRALERTAVDVSVVRFSSLLHDPPRILHALAARIPGLDPADGSRFVDPLHDRSSASFPDTLGEESRRDHPALEFFEQLGARAI